MNIAQTSLLHDFSVFVSASPVLLMTLDLFFKSTLVIGLTLLIGWAISQRSGSSLRHLLWLNGILCVALLPWIPLLPDAVSGATDDALQIFSVSVIADSAQISAGFKDYEYGFFLLTLPTLFLFIRLCLSLQKVLRISRSSNVIHDANVMAKIQRVRKSLQISRDVSIRESAAISSPFSFGLMRPRVILPATNSQWSDSVLEDVLVHELSHIRRVDWLSMLLCQLVLCFYWFNPLVWLAVNRVDEEAENSCDAAVIRCGKCNTEYAENLLLVARECRDQRKLLAQMMVNRKLLSNRITTILESPMMLKTISRKMIAVSVAIVATLLIGLGNVQLLAVQAQDADREMVPLDTPIPVYPRQAAEEGVEGWVWVRFDVNPDGGVSEDSISVVDSEPAMIFDDSAREATTRFAFSPRIREGAAVAVESVEYVFRYQLQKYEDNQAWLDSFPDHKPPQSN